MTLRDIEAGKVTNIVSVNDRSLVGKRLQEMGLVPGVSVRVVKSGPFGDPIEIRVRGYSLAVRKNEADCIEVSD